MENAAFFGGAALVVLLGFVAWRVFANKGKDRGPAQGKPGAPKQPDRPQNQK